MPSQAPAGGDIIAHRPRGSLVAAALSHTPFWPPFVSAAHDWHVSVQGWSQQKLSAQFLDAHSLAFVHGLPFS
jgi:hypothetical protein